jgi:hypothetical protein
MWLAEARVEHFKSIDDTGLVTIDPKVTVLVGQNEAGKTAFLQALEKARPIRKGLKFDVTEDYPRKAVNEYRKQHEQHPAVAVVLTFELTPDEVAAANSAMGAPVLKGNRYSISYRYDGISNISLDADEAAFVKAAVKKAKLPSDIIKAASASGTVRGLIAYLEKTDLNDEGTSFLASLKTRFADALKPGGWTNVVAHEVFRQHIGDQPRFLYFGDYQLLPGKTNLQGLQQRVANPAQLTDEDETVLRLLAMAEVSLDDVVQPTGYEEAKSRLEGLSITITDQVFQFWTQNKQLEVEFDIRPDPADPDARFKNGPNLYIRIKNTRHRVTVPFSQRSKGFIWFFSFLVWFDSVKAAGINGPIVLLLDEPGLSLHALAQADLLRYVDDVAERHQVLYTTHSPFMVHGDRLHQVRVVEDREKQGTVITANVTGSDPRTVFPLQAALGYTIAQNLFVSKRNLLVEGVADLVYLQHVSSQLDSAGRTGLRDDITIVPVGGLEKVSTFVSLLGANGLELAVVHDHAGAPDPHLTSLVREKVIRDSRVLNFGMFRHGAGPAPTPTPSTDVEDLFTVSTYLDLFNGAYAEELTGTVVVETALPPGERIVDRISRYLKSNGAKVRATDGFNHYRPATYLASHPQPLDAATLDRFEALFEKVNALLG